MGRRAHNLPGRAGAERGMVTLELGLMLPTVLFFLFGGLTLGHGYLVRHAMVGEAAHLAQLCVIGKAQSAQQCKQWAQLQLADDHRPDWVTSCANDVARVEASLENVGQPFVGASGNQTLIKRFRVELTCGYGGLFPWIQGMAGQRPDGRARLAWDIEASAVMTFTLAELP